jgi:hypothetical protein
MSKSRSDREYIAKHDSDPRVRITAIKQLEESAIGTESAVVYCLFCGAFPGAITHCPCTQSRIHSFREGKGPVYCIWCGATPGQPSPCPRSQGGAHSFKSR